MGRGYNKDIKIRNMYQSHVPIAFRLFVFYLPGIFITAAGQGM
jgi:hypothetical protein